MFNLPLLLLGGLAGFVALVVILLVHGWLAQRRALLHRRLTGKSSFTDSADILTQQLGPPPAQGWAARMDHGFDRLIEQTGLDMNAGQALGMICLTGVALGAAVFLWRGQAWLGLAGLVLGSCSILAVFWFMRTRHRRQLQNQIPDTFYLLARSLRAGLTLEQAIALTGEQGTQPLASEFQRCDSQIKLGLSVSAALQLTAKRVQLLDFDALVSTVALYQATGGNLPLLLDRLAAGARDRNQLRNHFLAATALGRVTAIGLGIATPLLLLAYLLFQPEFTLTFFQSTAGWTTVLVVFALEIVGIIWIYRLLKFEY
jgi:tight adherence protein B